MDVTGVLTVPVTLATGIPEALAEAADVVDAEVWPDAIEFDNKRAVK